MVRPDDAGGGGGIVLDPAAADRVRNRFDDLAAEFANTRSSLRSCYTDITGGCGELAGSVESGASKFLLSWNDLFDVCSTEAGLIAGNINNFTVDLAAFDRDSRTSITL